MPAASALPPPPGPIITQDYTNGRIIGDGEVKYYFFPIDVDQKDAMVMLNKTRMTGTTTNGDSYLMLNIQADINDIKNGLARYDAWTYPTSTTNGAKSEATTAGATEIIEVCETAVTSACENK